MKKKTKREKFNLSDEGRVIVFKQFVKDNYIPGVKLLLSQQKIDLLDENKLGDFGVSLAKNKKFDAMKILLERAINKQVGSKISSINLTKSLREGTNNDIIEKLISNLDDFSVQKFDTMLAKALKTKNEAMFEALFKKEQPVLLSNGKTPLHYYAIAFDGENIKKIIKKYPEVKKLIHVRTKGEVIRPNSLPKNSTLIPPVSDGLSPLEYSIFAGNTSAVKTLLQMGATLSNDNNYNIFSKTLRKDASLFGIKYYYWNDDNLDDFYKNTKPGEEKIDGLMLPLVIATTRSDYRLNSANHEVMLKMTEELLKSSTKPLKTNISPFVYMGCLLDVQSHDTIRTKYLNLFMQHGFLPKTDPNSSCILKQIYSSKAPSQKFITELILNGYDATAKDNTGTSFMEWAAKKKMSPALEAAIEKSVLSVGNKSGSKSNIKTL